MISIGEALVDALLLGIKGHPRVQRAVDWIADVAKPLGGVRLVADDGAEYTGVVVVDANRPRLMLAVRNGAGSSKTAEAPVGEHKRQKKPNGTAGGTKSVE